MATWMPWPRKALLIVLAAALSGPGRHGPVSAGSARSSQPDQTNSGFVSLRDFGISFDGRGLTGLSAPRDPYGAQVLAPNARLGVVVKYRVEGGDWLDLYQNDPVKTAPSPETVVFTNDVDGTVLKSA